MRRRRLSFTLPALASIAAAGVIAYSCGSSRVVSGPVDGAIAMRHVKAMVDLGPRPAGSPMLVQNRDYFRAELKKLGLPSFEQNWNDPASNLRMHNIWTEIPGADPAHGPVLILAAHYDTKLCAGHPDVPGEKRNFRFVGAIDGAGGSAVLLELARHLKDRKNVANIWILWFDGEESIPWTWNKDNSRALHGSKHFVQEMSKDKQRFPKGMAARVGAFVLLDLIGSKNQKIDRDKASHPQLTEIFLAAAKAMGEAKRMYESTSEMTDDHIPFKQYGIKVIDLIDFVYRQPGGAKDSRYEQWWHTEQDDLPAMDPASLQFVGNLVWNAIPLLEQQVFSAGVRSK
jgi:hypothetical protein